MLQPRPSFCIGLVAYNNLAVLKAALQRVHGAAVIETQLSGYSVTDEVSGTYRGMMIAIPPPEWRCFRHLTILEVAEVLIEPACHVRLARFRTDKESPRPEPQQLPYRSSAR